MSWAVRASLLIVIEARDGEWCTPAWLAGRVVAPIRLVKLLCNQLAFSGLVMTKLHFGETIYGQNVASDHAIVNDVRSDSPDSADAFAYMRGGKQP